MNTYKVKRLVEQMYSLFAPHINKPRRPPIYACDALPKLEGSTPTIIKVRKMLGIETHKVAGTFRWSYPKFTVAQALGREKKQDYICLNKQCPVYQHQRFSVPISQKKIICPACKSKNVRLVKASLQDIAELREAMQSGGYDVPADYILNILRRISRTRLYAAKQEIGITHYRDKDGFHWVLIADEVKNWLEKLFESGRVLSYESVLATAKTQKKWSSGYMLEHARQETGIQTFRKNGKLHWRDDPANVRGKSYTSPVEEHDTGGLISSDEEATEEAWDAPDYISENKDDRAAEWERLYRYSRKNFKFRFDYNRYRNLMRQKYPDEYEKLADRYIEPLEEIRKLRHEIKKLKGEAV
jgi:hypothetical protein